MFDAKLKPLITPSLFSLAKFVFVLDLMLIPLLLSGLDLGFAVAC